MLELKDEYTIVLVTHNMQQATRVADITAFLALTSLMAAERAIWLSWGKRQYAEAEKGAAVRDFVGWGLSKGQKFAEQLGYLPLPSEVTASGEQALGVSANSVQ